jgi:hypothetical protein
MDEVRSASAATGRDLGSVIRNIETDMVMEEGTTEAYVGPDEGSMEERASYDNRDLTIKHLHHGYIVEVDCHRFAFETVDRMMKYVGEYLKDPSGTEKKWWNKELF